MRQSLVIGAACWILSLSTTYAAEGTCADFANRVTKQAVGIFHDPAQSEAQKRQSLAVLFGEVVDTNWLGKTVLGRFWNSASEQEKTAYLSNYRSYITTIYIDKFNDEDAMKVEDMVVSAVTPQSAGEYQAKTIIKLKDDDDVQVDYLLAETNGKCMVHDITIEGISLIASERSEFGTLATSAGVQGVINAMQKRIHP